MWHKIHNPGMYSWLFNKGIATLTHSCMIELAETFFGVENMIKDEVRTALTKKQADVDTSSLTYIFSLPSWHNFPFNTFQGIAANDKCILAHSDNDIKWEMCTNSCTAFSVFICIFVTCKVRDTLFTNKATLANLYNMQGVYVTILRRNTILRRKKTLYSKEDHV